MKCKNCGTPALTGAQTDLCFVCLDKDYNDYKRMYEQTEAMKVIARLRLVEQELAELQRVAKEAIDIYADRCRADFGGSSKKEEAKITELRAALKGE